VFGTASATTVSSGGLQVVESGASATGAIVSSGGQDYIVSGGIASGAKVLSGGIETVFGSASGTTLSGGVQYDYAVAVGGTAAGAGAEQIVEAGALASGLTASGGGEEYVVAGGTASAAIIGSGGLEAVFGIDRGGTISHGTQYDYGTVSGGTIISSGEQIVETGAVASGMTVDSGGLEYIASGGTAVGTTISGGTLEVTSGANGGNVTFASGGILQLDSLVAFGGTISGFHLGDEIDLRGLAFTSGTTNLSWTQLTSGANASGTLTVSSGAAVETLTLLGQYTAANFSATSDGAGGTLITDPPASSSAIQTPLVAHH
jgi:autotransporter passenger strand-loop-strand repeat protein